MNTSADHVAKPPFAVWLTGPPASGKSTITAALVAQLAAHGVKPVVLESDQMRRILTPHATYSAEERDTFYAALVHLAVMFVEHGVPVILDATAHRRVYRDAARQRLPRFMEVFVATPMTVCRERDPKGLYRLAANAGAPVPGETIPYEAPVHADVILDGDDESPQTSAERIVSELVSRRWIEEPAKR